MPKLKTPTASTSPAAALIAKAAKEMCHEDPNGVACAELSKILTHNDVCRSMRERVGANSVVDMLRELGWRGASRSALDSFCARRFGRKSFGTP